MRVTFVGGCHLVGKPHGVQHGFVRLLWKSWRRVCTELHFDLVPYATNWQALQRACLQVLSDPQRQPDILILNLQSGLVLPTWQRTLQRLGLNKDRKEAEATENWFAPPVRPKDRSRWYWLWKKIAIVLLGGHREDWRGIEQIWANLSLVFAKAKTRVIVMSPTPVKSKYFVFGRKNLESVRRLVLHGADSGYYEVFDVYPMLFELGEKALWLDGQHLAKESHVLIAQSLGKMLIHKEECACEQ